MRRNCGVVAYDKLVGELNGRSNLVSMDTLAKLAQDNEFLLFPMQVPIAEIENVRFPAIVYTNHHFEVWQKIEPNQTVLNRPFVYMLSHDPQYQFVMSERDARQIKGGDMGQMFTPPKSKSPFKAATAGSTGGWAGFLDPDEGILGDWTGKVGTAAMGMIPYVGPYLAALSGAAGSMGGGTGFQGTDTGWRNVGPTLMGAASGYGAGKMGQSVGNWAGSGGFQSAADAVRGWGGSGTAAGAGAGGGNIFQKASDSIGNWGASPAAGIPAGAKEIGAAGEPGWAYTLPSGIPAGATEIGSAGQPGWAYTLPSGATPPAAAGAGIPDAAATGTSLWDTLFGEGGSVQKMAGTGTAGSILGQLFTDMPEYQRPPELDEYFQQMQQQKTPVGQLSTEELERVLSTPYGQLSPQVASGYIEQAMGRYANWAERERENISRKYNAYGRLNSSEHLQELSQVDTQLGQIRQELESRVVQEQMQNEMQYRVQALSQALGVEANAAAELAGFTQMAVEEAALKYGLEVAEVQNIRDMFSDVGMMMGM